MLFPRITSYYASLTIQVSIGKCLVKMEALVGVIRIISCPV